MTSESISTAAPTAGFSARRFVNDLRIGTKILALVTLAGILTAVVGVVGQQALSNLRTTSDRIGNETTQKAITALNAKYDYDLYRRLILRAALSTSVATAQELSTKADATLVTTRADLDSFSALGTDAKEK